MPYCPRCGVELDPSVTRCPLCSTAVPRFEDLGLGTPAWPAPGQVTDPNHVHATAPQTRRWIRGILGALFLTGVLVVTVVDTAINGGLTWSLWPLVSLVVTYGMVVVGLVEIPMAWKGLAWFFLIAGLLGGFDLVGGTSWFWSLGLPIDALAFGLVGLGTWAARWCRGSALLALGAALVGAGLMAVDGLISSFVGTPGLGWSLVTSVVFGALAVLFGALHLVLGAPRFHRIFHF